MRHIVTFLLVLALACPAFAAFKGPSAAFTPVTTAIEADKAPEGATCVLQGAITGHLAKDRYTFKDTTGSITVNIPPHVFGALDVAPADTVRLTGEIRGKKNPDRPDPHLGGRYIERVQ